MLYTHVVSENQFTEDNMMSKKNYVAFAAALANDRPVPLSAAGKAQLAQWQMMVKSIARVFATDNSRFDYHVFFAACGMEE